MEIETDDSGQNEAVESPRDLTVSCEYESVEDGEEDKFDYVEAFARALERLSMKTKALEWMGSQGGLNASSFFGANLSSNCHIPFFLRAKT